MRILLKSSLVAASALALVGPAVAQGDNERNGGRKIAATLTGAAEVPGPGDDNGAGLFEARVNPGTERICYTLAASSIDPATAAHIHQGGPSEAEHESGVAPRPPAPIDAVRRDDDRVESSESWGRKTRDQTLCQSGQRALTAA